MKILYIIRHAKSDWGDDDLPDKERPLAPRGLRDAPVMAGRLITHQQHPQHILSSPAVRAYTTCAIFCEALYMDIQRVQVEEELYFGAIPSMIQLIETALQQHDRIAVFGHNPNSSILAHYWCSDFHHDIPTCAIVAIGFEKEVGADSGRLLWYDYPKK
jgi:phosphohistidine phosphatase